MRSGLIPADLIDVGNMMLRPVVNYVGSNVTMWDRLLAGRDMTSFLALNKWVKDGVAFPGAAFAQWITQFYQQNLLIKGEITIRGERVDLSRISVPLLNIAGEQDHIATPQSGGTAQRNRRQRGQVLPAAARRPRGDAGRLRGAEGALAQNPRMARPTLGLGIRDNSDKLGRLC